MLLNVPRVIDCDCGKRAIKQRYTANGMQVIYKCSAGHIQFIKIERFKIQKEVA